MGRYDRTDLGAYSLGLLDAENAAVVERHLETCADCRAEVREFDVVRKEAQPADWHLGSGPRIGDLILSAHPPFFIEDADNWPWWAKWLGGWGPGRG